MNSFKNRQSGNTPRQASKSGNSSASSSNEAIEASTEDFPYSGNTNHIEVAHLAYVKKIYLIKVHRVRLSNQLPQEVEVLCDGGSTHSFISPAILTQKQKLIATDRSSSLFSIQNFVINNDPGES